MSFGLRVVSSLPSPTLSKLLEASIGDSTARFSTATDSATGGGGGGGGGGGVKGLIFADELFPSERLDSLGENRPEKLNLGVFPAETLDSLGVFPAEAFDNGDAGYDLEFRDEEELEEIGD